MTTALVTPQVRYEVVRRLVDCMTWEAIAQELGMDRADVADIARAAGGDNPARLAWTLSRLQIRDDVVPVSAAPESVVDVPLPDEVLDAVPTAAAPPRLQECSFEVFEAAPAGALFTDAAGRPVVIQAPLEQLHNDPDNPRAADDEEDLDDLAESMRTTGLLQPVVARINDQGRATIVAGHRRVAAARILGWSSISTIVRSAMNRDEVLAAMLVENGQRKDLDPIEESRALNHLKIAGGLNDQQLASRIGRSQPWVSARLVLATLSAEDQAQVRRGEMTLGEATERARVDTGRKGAPRMSAGKNYLSNFHTLASTARHRCEIHKHPSGSRLGKVACGECWEAVIRADERARQTRHSITSGECVTCGTTMPPPAAGALGGQVAQ